ncbi:tol-pal system-associated acyl-CoA thioesterase [Undibacterium rugosum]|uniref:Tol-pal system-associated acyl-CoA thioesterase n=1 Tax=Undibacterium rugosum TaxID=2762291 RepID=A0A923KYM7_9BURK|nr:tol-pal system-associated acyl-CoA thioesterase [Undibacterium rugosum]MBC3934548.1 tol-pal system-associated acyl-CoA thioesterase [Undibacterium rugosum]MBR7777162.1 tol-pal system-associated acyl-CoA thioesterase [Undibacterium rugosum]
MVDPFFWPVRVYYEDTDAGGIVFYANYLKFFERARTEWLRARGLQQQQMKAQTGTMFVVKSGTVEYHAPARLDDELTISVEVQKLGRASLHFVQEARCAERLLASGVIKVGCVDAESVRPAAIPDYVLDAIRK